MGFKIKKEKVVFVNKPRKKGLIDWGSIEKNLERRKEKKAIKEEREQIKATTNFRKSLVSGKGLPFMDLWYGKCPNCKSNLIGNSCDLCGWKKILCRHEVNHDCPACPDMEFLICPEYTPSIHKEDKPKKEYKDRPTEYYRDKPKAEYKEIRSRTIPKHVQREVWRRDMGRCVECGTKELLEYDHIIPFSKGGSNTAINIQLLCEDCNRKKSNKI